MAVSLEKTVIHSARATNAVVYAPVPATENARILNVMRFQRAAKRVPTTWKSTIISTIPGLVNKSLDVGSRS